MVILIETSSGGRIASRLSISHGVSLISSASPVAQPEEARVRSLRSVGTMLCRARRSRDENVLKPHRAGHDAA